MDIHKDAVPVFNRNPIAHGDAIVGGHRVTCDENLLKILRSEKNTGNIPYPQGKGSHTPDKHAIGADIKRFR